MAAGVQVQSLPENISICIICVFYVYPHIYLYLYTYMCFYIYLLQYKQKINAQCALATKESGPNVRE